MKLAWMDMSHDFIYQGAALATEYALSELTDIDMKYSRVLGEGNGKPGLKVFQQPRLEANDDGRGHLRLIFFGINAIGGEYNRKTGKNKWGMTELQMAGVSWLGTALLTSTYGKFAGANADFSKTFLTQFANFNRDYFTWGGTSPSLYPQGAGGWSEVRYLEKMAEWGGYANLAANADYAMKVSGYKSWGKFVKDGRAGDLFPSLRILWFATPLPPCIIPR